MAKIDGVDVLMKQLKEAQDAARVVEGDLGTVSFDPSDPMSIELAIRDVNSRVDSRLARYRQNPFVRPIIAGLKDAYRSKILKDAESFRLKSFN